MIKESIHQKDVTILNSRVPFNIKFKIHTAKLIELKGGINKSAIIGE